MRVKKGSCLRLSSVAGSLPATQGACLVGSMARGEVAGSG